jgi:hypothetical protein
VNACLDHRRDDVPRFGKKPLRLVRMAIGKFAWSGSALIALVREFTHSPVGPLPPNGQRVTFELTNIFRYDDQGRLADEWGVVDHLINFPQLRIPRF